jgi:hypothetical protein
LLALLVQEVGFGDLKDTRAEICCKVLKFYCTELLQIFSQLKVSCKFIRGCNFQPKFTIILDDDDGDQADEDDDMPTFIEDICTLD